MAKREKDPMALLIVAQALGRMGTKGDKVVNTLIAITERDERKYVDAVLAACGSLKSLGVNDSLTIQAVEKVLKHSSLEEYQKDTVKQIVADMKNPPKKKPLKGAAKVP